jgi:hypothetical protein
MVDDKRKIKIIWFIDLLEDRFKDSVYSGELKMMRLRYIYKDISEVDLKKDVEWLKNLKKI